MHTAWPARPSPLPQSVPPVTEVDTGLGTLFERWALNRLLARLRSELDLRTVVEGPDDGMTGIAGLNSLPLGLEGVRVSLVLPHPERAELARSVWHHLAPNASLETVEEWDGRRLPFEDDSFDLAWNFNVMTRQSDPLATLTEMVRISRRYVLVFVPNRLNYSFWLHRLHHRVARQPWDHGRIDLMRPEPWQRWFTDLGLTVRETLWIDCPWWPDIVDFGQLIADFCPPLKGLARKARPENRYRWTGEELPYYRLEDHPAIQQRLDRLSFFETSRWVWLKKCFAHHFGVLAVKN
ncbi:MAG TPA: methyltransferase domain-containing protein [Gemmataceae bacterium]